MKRTPLLDLTRSSVHVGVYRHVGVTPADRIVHAYLHLRPGGAWYRWMQVCRPVYQELLRHEEDHTP